MKRSQLFIIGSIIFFVCCSMSKCNTPGPETNISGTITDTVTGKPVSGLQIKVVNMFDSNDQYKPVTTNNNGNYSISFKPANPFGDYEIVIAGANNYYYYYSTFDTGEKINIGKNNAINLRVYKLVDVTINLKSTINKNQPNLEISFVGTTLQFQSYKVTSAIVDTTYHTLVPRLNTYTVGGIYYNSAGSGGAFNYDFSSNFYIGNADTTINIANP